MSQDRRIGSAGPSAGGRPSGVKVVDLGTATLLPGLIDSHAHLLSNVSVPTEDLFVHSGRSVQGCY
jgi:imidazolonepropionase-like amidohydrolase